MCGLEEPAGAVFINPARCMYACKYVWMDGWMDGWMSGWEDGCKAHNKPSNTLSGLVHAGERLKNL